MLILLSIKTRESVISVGPQFANHLTPLIPSCIESCKQSRGKPSSQCKLCEAIVSEPRVQRRMGLVVIFSEFLKLLLFCFVVAIFDLEHDGEAIHGLCKLLLASGNLF